MAQKSFYSDIMPIMNHTKKLSEPKKKERIIEVDLLRGLPIFLVVLFHLCYDFMELPSVFSNYGEVISNYPQLYYLIEFCESIMQNDIIHNYLVPLFAGMFLFACGISSSLTRSNLRRSLLLSALAIALSLGTLALSHILKIDLFIPWGILHLMAFSILIYSLMELFSRKLLKKDVHPLIPLVIGVLILFTGLLLREGITINNHVLAWPTTSAYLGNDLSHPFTITDFFYSAIGKSLNYIDWWPIFPFAGVIFIGIALGKALYGEHKKSYLKDGRYQLVLKPISFIGGHTIWVYILHQPVIIVILGCVMLCLGFRL